AYGAKHDEKSGDANHHRRREKRRLHEQRHDQHATAEQCGRRAAARLEEAVRDESPAKPPTIPKRQSSRPQLLMKNSAPGCGTFLAKIVYHRMIPLRKTPEVSSTVAMSIIKG